MLTVLDSEAASSQTKQQKADSIVKPLPTTADEQEEGVLAVGLDEEQSKLTELIAFLKLDQATLHKARAFLPIKVRVNLQVDVTG